jgi:hypothetical protein
MRKRRLFIVLGIFLIVACVTVNLSQETPLPLDAIINPPDPSLPVEIKALSGKWTGVWNSPFGWECAVYVEKVNRDSAQVVYSWGAYTTRKASCHCTPNWARVRDAQLEYSDGKATLKFMTPNLQRLQQRDSPHIVKGSGGRYTFSFDLEMKEPDIMNGHFISGKGSNLYVKMKKMD